ncbi:MAG: DEAD/DEAH box helicase [Pseudomonadales bacterium]|nr:DEAD/DEAH box helicase [Pseudomonadales bacterium]
MKFLKKLFATTIPQTGGANKSRPVGSNAEENSVKKSNPDKNKSAQKNHGQSPDQNQSQNQSQNQKKSRHNSAKRKTEQTTVKQEDIPPDFAELRLPNELNLAIQELGFQSCTPVQKEVLPYSLDGQDIIAQAQTGTGKTAAFLISAIAYDLENPEIEQRPAGSPFALIIAPTRELVLQISKDAQHLAAFTDIKVMSVMGGMDYEKQKQQLQYPIDIVIATPGRLIDFIRSRVIDLSRVETLIIDEADRMLSMGFIPDVKSIIARTPKKEQRQTQLFSATFSDDIKRLAASWTHDPARIEIAPDQVAVDSVEQRVYLTGNDIKFKVLYNLIISDEVERAIVFLNRRDQTRTIENKLYRQGIDCGLLSGEVAQKKRIRTLDDFRNGKIKVLVATDVAGRGIHVDGISHVINYNLPEDPEDYVHRIGRTGRAGATGVSISLACEDDSFMLPAIETLLGESFLCQQPPSDLLTKLPAPVRKPRQERETNDRRPDKYRRK